MNLRNHQRSGRFGGAIPTMADAPLAFGPELSVIVPDVQ